jgi:hypothetical protein
LIAGCDQDIFNNRCRQLHESFFLIKWEDGKTFYLNNSCDLNNINGGGLIEGTIKELGSNSKYIFIKRVPLFSGEPEDWIVIDKENHTLVGPFSTLDSNTQEKMKEVKLTSANEAWNNLR